MSSQETSPETTSTTSTPRRAWRFGLVLIAAVGGGLVLNAARPWIPVLARPGQLIAHPSSLEITPLSPNDVRREIEIQLTNSGDTPVRIESVTSSCGCTQVTPLTGTILTPGSSCSLRASVTVAVGNGNQALIQVQTDSQTTPNVTIPVQIGGRKTEDMFVSRQPPLLVLRGVAAGVPVHHEFELETVEPPDAAAPWLTGLKSTIEGVTAEIVEAGDLEAVNRFQSIRKIRVRVTALTPDKRGNDLVGYFHCQSAIPIPNEKPIPFRVLLEPPVRFVPEQVVFPVGPQTKYPMVCTVIVRGEPNLEILETISSHRVLEAELDQPDGSKESQMAIIKLRLLSAPPKDDPLQVRIRTRIPDEQERALAVVISDMR